MQQIKGWFTAAPLLWLIVLLFALFPIYTTLADLPFWNDVAMRIMLLGMAAMGLNLVLGYGGMVSFGHAAFIGIGAYVTGIANFYGLDNGWIQIALALGICAVTGMIIGFLSLRTSGIYFIMITLAFAQMLYFFFVSLEQFGGDDGMVMNRSDFVFIDLWAPLSLYYMIVAALALTALLLCVLVHSRFGVTLRALKSNQSRVEAMGLNALRFRITAYMISAMICGLAGALFANWQEYVSPDIMHWTRSGELMIVIVLGGLATLAGPLLGAVVFFLLEEFLPEILGHILPAYAENWLLVFGLFLIAVVMFGRGGLVGVSQKLRARFGKGAG